MFLIPQHKAISMEGFMKIERPKTDHLIEQMDRLTRHLEALRIADYIELLEKPWRLITTKNCRYRLLYEYWKCGLP